MWDFPGPGELMSPALAGRFLPTVPPRKSTTSPPPNALVFFIIKEVFPWGGTSSWKPVLQACPVFLFVLLISGSCITLSSVSLFVLSGNFSCSFNWEYSAFSFYLYFNYLSFLCLYEFKRNNSYLLWSSRGVCVEAFPCRLYVQCFWCEGWFQYGHQPHLSSSFLSLAVIP